MQESALKWKKMTQKLSNSMFLNVMASSFFSDFRNFIPRGVARFFQFRVEHTKILSTVKQFPDGTNNPDKETAKLMTINCFKSRLPKSSVTVRRRAPRTASSCTTLHIHIQIQVCNIGEGMLCHSVDYFDAGLIPWTIWPFNVSTAGFVCTVC